MAGYYKIFILTVFLSILFISLGACAQDAPEYLWARQFGGAGGVTPTGYTLARDIAVDSQGNAYVTGQFQYTAYFGGIG